MQQRLCAVPQTPSFPPHHTGHREVQPMSLRIRTRALSCTWKSQPLPLHRTAVIPPLRSVLCSLSRFSCLIFTAASSPCMYEQRNGGPNFFIVKLLCERRAYCAVHSDDNLCLPAGHSGAFSICTLVSALSSLSPFPHDHAATVHYFMGHKDMDSVVLCLRSSCCIF